LSRPSLETAADSYPFLRYHENVKAFRHETAASPNPSSVDDVSVQPRCSRKRGAADEPVAQNGRAACSAFGMPNRDLHHAMEPNRRKSCKRNELCDAPTIDSFGTMYAMHEPANSLQEKRLAVHGDPHPAIE